MPPPPEFQIREYQLEAWASVWDARHAGQTRALLHLATGLGKTTSAVFDVIKFQEECAAEDPPVIPRVLFVSHRNEISEQAQETFEYFLPDAQTAFFRTRQRDLLEADITFATFQSLHSQLDRFDPQDYEYIIYDEAHHSEAETFKAVREHFDPLFELALTATPDRLDELNIREYFGAPVYSKPLAEAIAESWLAEPDYHIVFDDAVREAMEGGFNPKTLGELKRLFMIKPRNEVIAKNVREERHKIGLDDAKTMVFCHSVEHANEMAALLGGMAYHSGIDRNERNRILRNFRTGSTQVICTVDMFNEGIDIPDAQLVVFLRSTQSPNIFEQQLGRGLRRAPGKERVSVLDFVANVERIAKVRELSQQIRSASGGGTEGKDKGSEGGGGTGGDLDIHTMHGDFDFDRLAVDLLEKWGRINSVPEAPEGWMSINGFAAQAGISSRYLEELVEKLDLELPVYKFYSTPGRALSPTHCDLLLARPEVSTASAPENYSTIGSFCRQIRIGDATLNSILTELNIEPRKLKAPGGQIRKMLAPEQQQQIMGHPIIQRRPPEGAVSVTAFYRQYGLTPQRLDKVLHELGIELPTYRTNAEGKFLLPDVQQTVITALGLKMKVTDQPIEGKHTPSIEEGWVRPNEAAVELGINRQTLERIIRAEGIQMAKRTAKGRIGFALSPSQLEIIRLSVYFQNYLSSKQLKEMTRDDIVALAKNLSPDSRLETEDIKRLSRDKSFVGVNLIYKKFGSIPAFQRACGFTPENK